MLQSMSISRCLTLCIVRHPGIPCDIVGFLRGLLVWWLACGLGLWVTVSVGSSSNFFPGNAGVRHNCILAQTFQHLYEPGTGQRCGPGMAMDQSGSLTVSAGVVMFAEWLRLWWCCSGHWVETQPWGAGAQSVHVCGSHTEILEMLPWLHSAELSAS